MSQKVTYTYALARLMRRRGFSLRRLALEAGVDRAGLRRIKRGTTAPSWAVACRIADAMGLELSAFVGRRRKRVDTAVPPNGAIESEESENG